MIGFIKINLRDMLETMEASEVNDILSEFYCPQNKDVEEFLKNKAVVFSEQGIASTHLIFASYKDSQVLVGYFALASKHFHIDPSGKSVKISNTLKRRVAKFATYDRSLGKYIIAAPLIGQLGKNFNNGCNKLITGDELLKIACDTVKEAQRIIGGKFVYLECEDIPKLVDFYEGNGFYNFGRRELDGDEKSKFDGKYLIQMLKYLGR